MKKMLVLCLALCLSVSMLAGCGGGTTPSTSPSASPTAKASATPSGNSSDEYSTAMSEYIASFESLMENKLGPIIASSQSVESEEELIQWCKDFIEVKTAIGKAADSLASVVADVPAEYQESHAKITVATAAVYDAMTGFEDAVDAAINGDAVAFENGLVQFVGNIQGADQLWEEAVER